MAQINFPVATADGQVFEAPTGVVYTYVGTPPNGYWSGTFQSPVLTDLDTRYLKLDASNDPITGDLYIDSNVGIGNSSPQGQLHVDSAVSFADTGNNTIFANNNHQRVVIASGDSHVADLQFRKASDTENKGMIRYDTYGNMRIYTDGDEAMRIDSSGNVGIGTTPVKPFHAKSSVDEILRLETPDNQTGNMYQSFHDSTGELGNVGMFNSMRELRLNNLQSDGRVTFRTNNSEQMRIDESGNVGIGTDAPQRLLHVSNSGSQNDCEIRIENTDGEGRQITFLGDGSVARGIRHTGVSAGDALEFTAGSNTHMLIDSNGVINYPNCPTYADDSAAGTGGLVAGDIYKTSAGDLKIKL